MLAVFPGGFEEADLEDGVELAGYAGPDEARRVREAFGSVGVESVAPGWEDAWKRFHLPVRIGPVWIGPPWEPRPGGDVAVVIDPGRAFGTGAHPTTRLSLELLLTCERASLVDLGSGSGVLAIAATKLGFAPVTAVDADPAALAATRANAEANDVEIAVLRADVLVERLPAADTVVANIALAPAERVAARVAARVLVTSGYLASERPCLDGWAHAGRRQAEGWAADVFRRARA